LNLTKTFGVRKLESLGYCTALFVWFYVQHFWYNTILACDSQSYLNCFMKLNYLQHKIETATGISTGELVALAH